MGYDFKFNGCDQFANRPNSIVVMWVEYMDRYICFVEVLWFETSLYLSPPHLLQAMKLWLKITTNNKLLNCISARSYSVLNRLWWLFHFISFIKNYLRMLLIRYKEQ